MSIRLLLLVGYRNDSVCILRTCRNISHLLWNEALQYSQEGFSSTAPFATTLFLLSVMPCLLSLCKVRNFWVANFTLHKEHWKHSSSVSSSVSCEFIGELRSEDVASSLTVSV